MARSKKQTEEKKKPGRPEKELDIKNFENLCALQCTKEEICSFLGMSDKTLDRLIAKEYDGRSFSEVFAEKRGRGKISLRRAQFRLAEKNAAMAIWLGRNYLGQTEQVQTINENRTTLDLSGMSTDQIKELLDREIS